MKYEFAKSIGCEIKEDKKYPLTHANFLQKLASWTKETERKTAEVARTQYQ